MDQQGAQIAVSPFADAEQSGAAPDADPPQAGRLAAFLCERPAAQIRPNIVPKISDKPWARSVLDAWNGASVSGPVKAAIKRRREDGHIPV